MIEVIKAGQPKGDTPMKGRCIQCDGTVRCIKSDATWLEDRPGDGCFAVRCPTKDCGGWAYLKEAR